MDYMLYKIFTSYITMFILLSILAVGAAIGTFIENDYGSIEAKRVVYYSWWYELTLIFSVLNILAVVIKTKMYKVKPRALFHISFLFILVGAGITHFFGIDGTMHIREGKQSNIILVGKKEYIVPFSIKLEDFTLKRYPGSRSPSEFSSDVVVLDEELDKEFRYKIYMNHTLSYRGYKFFQTSYDSDEKGTKLSVNKDPGVEVTYIGYAMLFLGLIWTLLDKKSRFRYLVRKIQKMPIASIAFAFLVVSSPTLPLFASDSTFIQEYIKEHRTKAAEVSQKFGTLIVQAPDGRMKPLNTQNREVLSKISGSYTWNSMDADMVMLGIFSKPSAWKKIEIIRVKTKKLRKYLGVSEDKKLLRFVDFFNDDGKYILSNEVDKANRIAASKRGTYERDLIQVDERLNVFFMAYRGVLFTIFPLPNDEKEKWVDFKSMFSEVEDSNIKRSVSKFLDATYNRQYEKALPMLDDITAYQYRYGNEVIPSKEKLDLEIWFNSLDLFFKLALGYLFFGILLLIYSIVSMFNNKLVNEKIKKIFSFITMLLFVFHSAGIAIRWYVGGYIPISNTYETMVYIAYASIIVSLVFFRKSTLALAAAFVMAGVFLFGAYLGEVDPQITSLVPVLKSYWLSIHVSVITASYGFFGVSAILGLVMLLLFSLRDSKREYINKHIQNIAYINEAILILGLVLLVIGNFLGGIWANESWGRYWGWDPKETWAYISIIVYTLVIHLRLIQKFYSLYLFSILSVLSFYSILMTYFGVNFYLAGMHSYATGDPIPIPIWVYVSLAIVFVFVAMAYPKRKIENQKGKFK